MTTESKELTLVDRIAQDLISPDAKVKVPLSSVFGRGALAKDESFGGHFDAYYHIVGESKGKFAPFSHTAGYGGQVPEPGTLVLLGAGLTAAAGFGLSRGRRRP